MRLVDQTQWGFLLEHDNMPFFVPLKSPLPMKMQSKVKLRDDLVVVINSGDYPFYIDNEGNGHIILKDSEYAKMIMTTIIRMMTRR